MNRILRLMVLLLSLSLFASAQTPVPCSAPLYCVGNYRPQDKQPPKYEYRAVWITTIENLDWPRTKVKNPCDVERQKREMEVLLDSLQAMHINTVLLQVRVRGDVIYPSAIEPFSHVLTGVSGKDPGYDPLSFAIAECHRRGMQLHAWLVTLPLGKVEHVRRLGRNALPNKKNSLCTRYKGSWYMEPGNPATAVYITSLVKEIVQNYDVDGIHLDYVRYPDSVDGYPDGSLYRKHGNGESLASWRRSNITAIVSSVYLAVKELKPWVRVSCAPLGKHDNLTRYSSLGWDAYNTVFQDAQGWLRDGIMDIVFPMLYFDGNNFYPFVRDWCENNNGRHIVPGIGIYRLSPQHGGWPSIEIERQMRTSRSAAADGVMMFRTAHLVGNISGARDIYTKVFDTPALVPPMEWVSPAPATPSSVGCVRDMEGVTLQWSSVPAPDGYPPVRYNLYAVPGDSVDVENSLNLVATSLNDTCYRYRCRTNKNIAMAVTAVNACGVESEPLFVTAPLGGRMVHDDVVRLPEPLSWGQRIEVCDLYGRVLHFGKFTPCFNVNGFAAGQYILKVYNRYGALLHTVEFAR
ncbi:MAG: family 10 glycosylhydrolase [Bacteroidaceae bacterium]|nr:family 10 glycosylhydrolase [Bacteroidaceae bacterium]